MTIEGTTFVITGGARVIGAVLSDVLVADGEAVASEITVAGGEPSTSWA